MRRDTIGAVAGAGLLALLCATATVAAPSAGRFTISRTLPDGRTEIRSVTLDELRAMSRPVPAPAPTAKTMAPDTVVFALPAPIPDPVSAAPALVVAAPTPTPAVKLDTVIVTAAPKAAANQGPSAAAIRVATAERASALHAPPMLSGGWALVNRDDAMRDDGVDSDAAPPTPLRATRPGKRKGDKTPLGVRDGKSFGQQGRLYLYAGVKNRGLGLNLTDHNGDESGGWDSAGVSYDKGGFAGQRSAGVGWRQGDVSTSLGWVHEKNNIKGMYGAPAEKDDRVALTFSWRPSVRQTSSRRSEP